MLQHRLKNDDEGKLPRGYGDSWMCVHCRERNQTTKELSRHLSIKRVHLMTGSKSVDANNHSFRHGITEARRGAGHDFVLNTDRFADPWKTDLVLAPM
jgi:hypothetical protein